MAKAVLIYRDRTSWPDGSFAEFKIWRLPVPTGERPHGLKYSLFYGKAGERIIGYDNEAGKGDHRHYRQHEEPYAFVSVDQLVADFLADIATERNGG